MEKLTSDDLDAMNRAIAIVRAKGGPTAELIAHKLKREGIEEAGFTAACIAQSDALKLRPWETAPADPWGQFCEGAIELRNRLVAARLSVYEPDPMQALAETERAKVQTAK
jgi:hypothetical protein